ncbi:MAG: ATP-binding cassette domain-containing protein, partial [Gammaproteobacteria bacterium]
MEKSNDRRTEELLRIEDLVVSFPKENMEIAVLNSINLSVGQGEIVGIVGESGSGKSIACRSIIGLIPKPGRVSSGKIMFDGKNVLAINKAEERILRSTQIGMIFQDPTSSLNPVFTIGDELVKTLVNSGTSSKNLAVQKSIELLERVGLQNPSKRIFMYPHEL